jgi:tripartite-type tricarboxylate transporter receptor subunit TctC
MRPQVINRKLIQAAGAGVLAMAGVLSVHASEWPARPIKLIVPYPAGGLTDIVSRVLSDEVGKALGTTVLVENKAGAGGQIGLQTVLQAPKDGYTVALVVPATMITLPLTNPDYKIKPLEQFEPITIAIDTFLTMVVSNRLGVKNLKEFVDYAKKQPGVLNYGIPGTGTSFHFNNVVMNQKLGIDTHYAPYKGEGQILNDIVGGSLDYALVSNAGKAFVDSGQVTALGVTSSKRVSSMPQIPTFRESGVDFTTDGWVGYVVAQGTPKPVLNKLNTAFVKALNTPTIKQKFLDMGYQVVGGTPEQFVSEVRMSTKRYADLLSSGAVKLE